MQPYVTVCSILGFVTPGTQSKTIAAVNRRKSAENSTSDLCLSVNAISQELSSGLRIYPSASGTELNLSHGFAC